jgi:hypothetical protein
MEYITSHNCLIIVKRNSFKDFKLEGEIYKSKITIFSKHDENSLLAVQELMRDPDKYFKEIYNPIVAKDTKQYVYKEQQPAYHSYLDCSRLSSNYRNFELPGEIKDKGDLEIKRFRHWFKENEYLLDNPEVFVMRLQMAFGITYNPKAINYENSGFDEFNKNYTVKDLEDKIDSLLREAGNYYRASEKNSTILGAFVKMSGAAFYDTPLSANNTKYSDKEVKEVLKEYHLRFKSPLKKFLVEYYRVKLNPDLQFAENLLEALGFNKCGTCKKREVETGNKIFYAPTPLSPIMTNGKWGFCNRDNNLLIDGIYEEVGPFSEGLAAVQLNGKWGFIDSYNEIKVPFVYDEAEDFLNGKAEVKQNGKWGKIDKNGSWLKCPFCPDKSDPRWEVLVREFGEGHTHALWRNNGEEFPTVAEARVLMKDWKHIDMSGTDKIEDLPF